jgi:antirestriction protein ArdC
MLEEGMAPWQRPWESGESGQMPYNPTTKKPYRGGNVLALMIAGMRKGYSRALTKPWRRATRFASFVATCCGSEEAARPVPAQQLQGPPATS